MEAYRKAIKNAGYIDINKIAEEIVNMPYSRFWVSEERAMLVISAIDRGTPVLDTMRPLKREMFEKIYERVCKLRKDNTYTCTAELVMMAVNSQAPKLYMRPRCALDIIYKIKRGFYERRQDNFSSPRKITRIQRTKNTKKTLIS